MTRWIEDLLSYYENNRSKKDSNSWRSFTMGACLYDYISSGYWTFRDLWLEDYVIDYIENESGARRERIEYQDDKVLVELVDIAYLWELVEEQEDEYKQEQKDELFDELDDNWDYKSRDEVEKECERIIDDYYIDEWLDEIVDEYIDDRGLDFDEMLYDYLDWYTFVDKTEIIGAIEQYFYPDEEGQKENASYWELSEYDDIANKYIEERWIEFEEGDNK